MSLWPCSKSRWPTFQRRAVGFLSRIARLKKRHYYLTMRIMCGIK